MPQSQKTSTRESLKLHLVSLAPDSPPFLSRIYLQFLLAYFKVFDDPVGMNDSLLVPLHLLYFGRIDDPSPQPGEIETVRALFFSSDNIQLGVASSQG